MKVLKYITILASAFAIHSGCAGDFAPFPEIERLRVLGVKADYPEFCPADIEGCPAETARETVQISILAADKSGIIADGSLKDAPFLKAEAELKWALCDYSFRGSAIEDPDCTRKNGIDLEETEPFFLLSTKAVYKRAIKDFQDFYGSSEFSLSSVEGVSLDQYIGFSISYGDERDWGIKGLTLSNAPIGKANSNPILQEITLNGVKIDYGSETPFEIRTNNSYYIKWKFEEKSWESYTAKTIEGEVVKKELMTLAFWATEGSFSKDMPVAIWQQNEKENELFYRPPREVPEEGLEAALIFKLSDGRGGSDWIWTKIKILPGELKIW